jgi:hypothetical protein
MSSPAGTPSRLFPRCIAFCARHPLWLQALLFAGVWLLYGSLALHGQGRDYYSRATDFWLTRDPDRFDTAPGVENILLPAVAAVAARLSGGIGVEFTDAMFVALTVAPYPLFILGLTRLARAWGPSGRVLAAGSALALYTSGFIPYMASWGGYVDGVSYLLMLPVLLWPESLAVFATAFVLQCLNHYLGAVSLVVLAFVWHSLRALERADGRAYWVRTFVPKAIVGAAILAGFTWFWQTLFPEEAAARQAIVADKWSDPEAVLQEVLGPFPWTMLSALKLGIAPIAALMIAPLPSRGLRMLTLAAPFAIAFVLTFVFVDITRVATMLILPALIVTIHAAASSQTPVDVRRRVRRWLVAAAVLNLLVPNYYVNNGALQVPPSPLIRGAIEWSAAKTGGHDGR